MENASKALIIAGAVLISILLISAGILIMNKSKDVTGQAEATSDALNQAATEQVSNIKSNLGL